MLRIVADANIPAVHEAFRALGTLRVLPGSEITAGTVQDADVLLVRSVTPVDTDLLADSPVRFVGSATAGTDHVDRDDLRALGTTFAHAPGSNATSVVEWVVAALLATAVRQGEGLEGKTLGVVGAGEVGGRLVPRARALGMEVVVSDPPKAALDAEVTSLDLNDLLSQADVVTLHTPLATAAESPWPTARMMDQAAFGRMKPGAWFINAARGRIAEAEALQREAGRRPLLLDVWPGEPAPALDLVERAALGTPHIAGYAYDAKVRGTVMLADALRQWLAAEGGGAEPWDAEAVLRPEAPLVAEVPDLPARTAAEQAAWLDALVRQAYDLRADDARFRAAMAGTTVEARAAAFAELRRTYPRRREWDRYVVRGDVPSALRTAVSDGLAMSLGAAETA